MKLAIAAVALLSVLSAQATCIGSGSMYTCSDASGNTYNVNRMGNTTFMNGYNAQTGSQWNQTSQTMGNTTFHNGTAANGNSWNGTSTNIGNTQFYNGTDSRGNSYSRTCTRIGDQVFCN